MGRGGGAETIANTGMCSLLCNDGEFINTIALCNVIKNRVCTSCAL